MLIRKELFTLTTRTTWLCLFKLQYPKHEIEYTVIIKPQVKKIKQFLCKILYLI